MVQRRTLRKLGPCKKPGQTRRNRTSTNKRRTCRNKNNDTKLWQAKHPCPGKLVRTKNRGCATRSTVAKRAAAARKRIAAGPRVTTRKPTGTYYRKTSSGALVPCKPYQYRLKGRCKNKKCGPSQTRDRKTGACRKKKCHPTKTRYGTGRCHKKRSG